MNLVDVMDKENSVELEMKVLMTNEDDVDHSYWLTMFVVTIFAMVTFDKMNSFEMNLNSVPIGQDEDDVNVINLNSDD